MFCSLSSPKSTLFEKGSSCLKLEDQAAEQIFDEKSQAEANALEPVLIGSNKSLFFSEEQKKKFEACKADNFLSKRFIAHLFGDSFMRNSIYEGWFISDALLHMIQILKENEISPEVSRIIVELESCLEWQEKLFLIPINNDEQNDDIEVENTDEEIKVDHEEIPEPILSSQLETIISQILEAIQNLEEGQKVILPGGCIHHSTLYEVRRDADGLYSFAVYNTGGGVEKHNIVIEDEGIEKIYGVYRIYNVNLEDIATKNFLAGLIKIKQEVDIADYGEKLYNEHLSTLGGIVVKPSTDPNDYMRMQRSGTCSWKMLSAYLRYNLPLIQRKYIKLKSRLDVFQKWYDMGNKLDCVKTSQRLLCRMIVNYKGEIFRQGHIPMNLSREELLTLGIFKVRKTFNKYKYLLTDEMVSRADQWHRAFTGDTILVA